MPKTALTHEFDLKTRNDYTKVDAKISLSVDGKELPSMSIIGEALEQAQELIQTKVTESYKVVPERV